MTTDKLRKIAHVTVDMKPFPPDEVGDDPAGWLQQQAQPEMLLLVHMDDAVVWGRAVVNGNEGVTFESSSPEHIPLRNQTLIMARLFDAEQEIFLWQVREGQWRARLLRDGIGNICDYFDETQILWGNEVTKKGDKFVHLIEGAQGMRHMPPEELLVKHLREHRAALTVRHYLQDDDGWLRVVFSRLVKPQTEEVSA